MSQLTSAETEASSSTSNLNSTSSGLSNPIVPPSVREIHKNGWLKRLPQSGRRHTPFGKTQKPEKMWIVFCIHDDVEAFLEYYDNRRSAFSHRPTLSVPLANCLHISPNIVVQQNDYVFSITMENQSIKLAASTREQMTEWIDTLQAKLTELGILSPPHNLYSRGPEIKPLLAPNRDPNSPLPPPPSSGSPLPIIGTELHSSNNRAQSTSRSQENVSNQVVPETLHATPSSTPLANANVIDNNVFISTQHSSVISSPSPPTEVVTPSSTSGHSYLNVNLNTNSSTETMNLSNASATAAIDAADSIYEPLCLASSASASCPYALPNPHYNVDRRNINEHQSRRRIPSNPEDEVALVRNSLRPRAHSEDNNATPTTSSEVEGNNNEGENSRPMTLREKQVFQLCNEMNHKAGVKLILSKKDCVNSIAFAEYLGCLWISGWKQKEHPVLYHHFHIGDRIIRVAGVKVNTISDYNRVVKAENSSKIEFVIGRLPFGKAIYIEKEREGQDLGIIRDGNTAEIVEVVENGLAASYGLSAKAQSPGGNGNCNWTLTEINGRSLNLFFKDHEIHDRLNAVGKNISILVQPSDFVKVLKKQLRAMWNHKDYILQ
ncbi:hypothetical protein CHUAL_006914 [Chamberlinius hualienensis]